MSLVIGHACCGSYENGLFGGVPRFDYQFRRTFPNRVLLTSPQQIITFCQGFPNCIIFADNHYAIHVPRDVSCVVVHHGCAAEHFALTGDKSLEPLAIDQGKIWTLRDPENTIVVTCSSFCKHMFHKHYGSIYDRFDSFLLLHACEHDESFRWMGRSIGDNSPIRVVGNFSTPQKGRGRIEQIAGDDIVIRELRVDPPRSSSSEHYKEFERRKQVEYASYDVFLQLSLQEGYCYATLDALAIGMPVVATATGLCFEDLPENAFVRIDRHASADEIQNAIRRAHVERKSLAEAAREFCQRETRFVEWQEKIKLIALTAAQKGRTVS
jgi:glycosyltransferase involved in cell wall biosynthesis